MASRETAERAAGQTPAGAGNVEVARARLLVVDDEQRILDFVARGLRAEGYTVDVARDGQVGLDAALTQPYDLVILDLLMPDMTGFQLMDEIKKEPSLRSLPIIVYTGRDLTKKEETQLKRIARRRRR